MVRKQANYEYGNQDNGFGEDGECRDGKGGEEKVGSQLKLFMADFPETELSWTLTEEDKMQEPDHKHDNEEQKEGNSD